MTKARNTLESGANDYDLASLSRRPGVIEPKQARSMKMLEGVLGAFEGLLKSKKISEITIPAIATEAGCSAAAIYGRFKNKDSLLASLHESVHDRMRARWGDRIGSDVGDTKSIQDAANDFCAYIVEFGSSNRNLIAAALMSGNPEIYERTASTIRHCTDLFCGTVANINGAVLPRDRRQIIEIAVRSVFALVEQRIIFYPISVELPPIVSDEKFARHLSSMLVSSSG